MKMNNVYCGDGFPNLPDFANMGGSGATYTAGDGIAISTEKAISADVDGETIGINETTKKLECLITTTTYTAGDGIAISGENEISADVGDGLTINAGGEIVPDVDGTTIKVDSTTKKLKVISGGGGSWDYSTATEVDTGQKWVDGKEIYCKSFETSAQWAPGSYGLGTGIGFETVIDMILRVNEYQTGNQFVVHPYYGDGSRSLSLSASSANGGTLNVTVAGSFSLAGTGGVATIFYTKPSTP